MQPPAPLPCLLLAVVLAAFLGTAAPATGQDSPFGNFIFQFEASYLERGFDWTTPGTGIETRTPPVQMTIGAIEFPFLAGWSYPIPRLNLAPVLLMGAARDRQVKRPLRGGGKVGCGFWVGKQAESG